MRVAWDMTHAGRIRGGTGVYARALLSALSSEEDVDAVAIAPPPDLAASGGGLAKLVRGARQVCWTQAGLAREARRLGADVLHAPAFVSSLFLPCPLVVTVHDMAYRRYPGHYSAAWLAYLRLLVPLVVRRATAVLADSWSTRADVVRFLGVAPEKVHVVHLGVYHDRFRPVEDRRRLTDVAARHGLELPFVLHTGGLAARKDVATVVRAVAALNRGGRCPRQRLVLTGEESVDLPGRAAVVAAVERSGMADDVVWLGHVPEEDLPALYTLAGLVAVPSLYEGFGLPALEAMACGTPVVASDTSSLPEVVGDAGLLPPPGDAGAWADAMARAITDTELRERMVRRGLQRAAGFSWGRAARETAMVYRRVLERRPSAVAEEEESMSCSLRRSL